MMLKPNIVTRLSSITRVNGEKRFFLSYSEYSELLKDIALPKKERVAAESMYKRYVGDNLEKTFTSPLKPFFGPIFPRPDWQKYFNNRLNRPTYLVYYGPSSLGKSLAVCEALNGRKGVILARVHDNDNIFDSFIKASAFLGENLAVNSSEIDRSLLKPSDVITIFADACKTFAKKHNQLPVLVVEDLHGCKHDDENELNRQAITLASSLIRIHNDGYLNVVYTMSDFTGVSLLQNVSGHSERMEAYPFPLIPDEELIQNLIELSIDHQKVLVEPLGFVSKILIWAK